MRALSVAQRRARTLTRPTGALYERCIAYLDHVHAQSPGSLRDLTMPRRGAAAAERPHSLGSPTRQRRGATASKNRVLMVLGCARRDAPVLLCCTPVTERNHAMHRVLRTVLTGLACATLVATASSTLAQTGGEWPYYGGDQANTR